MGCRESIFTQPRKTDIRKQIQTERCGDMLTFGESTLGVEVRCHGVRGPRAGSGTVCTVGISCVSFTHLGCLVLSQFYEGLVFSALDADLLEESGTKTRRLYWQLTL